MNYISIQLLEMFFTNEKLAKLGTYNFMMINKILQYKMYLDNK